MLKSLLLFLFPLNYFEIHMWKELVVSIPMGRDIFEFKKIFVGLWDAQSGGKVYLHIYFEASSVRSYQCEWK